VVISLSFTGNHDKVCQILRHEAHQASFPGLINDLVGLLYRLVKNELYYETGLFFNPVYGQDFLIGTLAKNFLVLKIGFREDTFPLVG